MNQYTLQHCINWEMEKPERFCRSLKSFYFFKTENLDVYFYQPSFDGLFFTLLHLFEILQFQIVFNLLHEEAVFNIIWCIAHSTVRVTQNVGNVVFFDGDDSSAFRGNQMKVGNMASSVVWQNYWTAINLLFATDFETREKCCIESDEARVQWKGRWPCCRHLQDFLA